MFSSLEHSLQDDQLQLALKQAGKHSEVGEKIRLIVVVLYRRPAPHPLQLFDIKLIVFLSFLVMHKTIENLSLKFSY